MVESFSSKSISDEEYEQIRSLFFKHSGILLGIGKKPFAQNRLQKRLNETKCPTYQSYYNFITAQGNEGELEKAINLLTTNETYFFREFSHFEFLKENVLPHYSATSNFRVWSAASSSGEEGYSIAMLLDDHFQRGQWEVIGTDLNTDVLDFARRALYPMSRIDAIPDDYLKKYFLKGKGKYLNYILVDQKIRARTRFQQLNLMGEKFSKEIGQFNVIFLRNVMIYFSVQERQKIVKNIVESLAPGGWLIIGLSESLLGLDHKLVQRGPSIYQRINNV